MKNTKTLLSVFLLFSISLFTISCNHSNAPVYEKFLKLKNASWDRFDIKHFEIPFGEKIKNSDITVVVHCTEKFKYDNLPLYVILTSPTGEETIRELSVPVRKSGKLITEPNGTKSESRVILWGKLSDIKGNYKISIENMTPVIQTEGIDEVGIVVTESK